jgi:ribonuclease HII
MGPLVVAGVLMKQENLSALAQLGVKDSKLLTPKKREALSPEIMRLAEKHVIFKLQPCEIDRAVESQRRLHKLNRLEADTMAKIVTALEPDVAYVDAADVLEKRFALQIQEAAVFKTQVVAEHKADKNHAVVSAASILAKVERDQEAARLRGEFGDFGSGYLTDPKTKQFLNGWLKTHADFPDCVRKSWKPAKEAKNARGTTQTTLG